MSDAAAPIDAPLVCQRIATLAAPPVASYLDQCALCAHYVWVAYSSPTGHPIWCWECAGMEIAKADAAECASPTAAQIADIEANWRRPSFVCPQCGARSYHPTDIEERYCGRCRMWVDER